MGLLSRIVGARWWHVLIGGLETPEPLAECFKKCGALFEYTPVPPTGKYFNYWITIGLIIIWSVFFFSNFTSHDDIMRSSSNHSSIFFLYPLNFKILFIFFNLRVFDFGWKSCDCWMPRILRLEGFSLPPAVRQCRAPVGCAEAVNDAFQWRGGLGAVSEE